MNKDSRGVRKQAVINIHKLRILLRISKDLSLLSYPSYEYASKLLFELREIVDKEGMVKDENLQRFI